MMIEAGRNTLRIDDGDYTNYEEKKVSMNDGDKYITCWERNEEMNEKVRKFKM